MSVPTAWVPEINKLQQGPWRFLITQFLDGVNVVRLTNHTSTIVFDGQSYTPFAFRIEDISQNAQGKVESTQVVVASPNGVFQSYIEQYNGLTGQRCIITIVHLDYLNDPSNKVEFFYRVESTTTTSTTIVVNLATRLDETFVKAPQRRIVKLRCQHTYRGEGCWLRDQAIPPFTYSAPSGFVSATSGDPSGNSCSKILDDANNGCQAHQNQPRFGGFPGVADRNLIIRTV